MGKPEQENPAQLNIDISSNHKSKTDLSITEPSNPIPSNPQPLTGDGERTRSRIGTDGMGARETYREIVLENIDYLGTICPKVLYKSVWIVEIVIVEDVLVLFHVRLLFPQNL